LKKLNSIRYWFLQNYLMLAFISTLILFIGFQLLLVNRSVKLTIENTFWFSMIAFIVFLFVGAYFGYRSSSLLKGRLTDLEGFQFGFKVFVPVIPIAAFFY
ncbi:hypothetical protein PZE06_28050, partial [Robertmurraya sp. DFI.2.37]|nr:hypothetical protein [Robertmurraya sp. DFI.2.37]